MTIDKAKLKALAEAANAVTGAANVEITICSEAGPNQAEIDAVTTFAGVSTPAAVLALLAEIERLSPPAGQVSYQQQMEAWKSASSQDLRARGELMIQVDELKAENEALRKDAQRYRWLRDKQTFIWLIQDWFPGEAMLTNVDADIDAAMAKEVSHG